jgi:undecaprenyl-diphosphatase
MNKKNLARLGLFFVTIFGIFAFWVTLDLLNDFDYLATIFLQQTIPTSFDTFFSTFSLFGSVEITTLILLILVGFSRKIQSVGVILLFMASQLLEVAGKFFITHPGPPGIFHRYDIPVTLPSFFIHPGSSFPSGHSLRTAFIAVLVYFISTRSKKLGGGTKILIACLIVLLSLIMYLSRVYLGEHWTSDVIGGFLLGTGFALLSLRYL